MPKYWDSHAQQAEIASFNLQRVRQEFSWEHTFFARFLSLPAYRCRKTGKANSLSLSHRKMHLALCVYVHMCVCFGSSTSNLGEVQECVKHVIKNRMQLLDQKPVLSQVSRKNWGAGGLNQCPLFPLLISLQRIYVLKLLKDKKREGPEEHFLSLEAQRGIFLSLQACSTKTGISNCVLGAGFSLSLWTACRIHSCHC